MKTRQQEEDVVRGRLWEDNGSRADDGDQTNWRKPVFFIDRQQNIQTQLHNNYFVLG